MLSGIHHVTALSGAAPENLAFYVGTLGLRRVKTTVNFDDPKTHHLYYGDTVGRPGTIITFFPWSQARSGRPGAGMVHTVAFSVPTGTLDAWTHRLDADNVSVTHTERFGEPVLQFEDPSGLSLALVASDEIDNPGAWRDGPVPAPEAIRGIHAATLPVFADDRTPDLFTDVFGWTRYDHEEDCVRFEAPDASTGGVVDLQIQERHPSGRMGQGTVHHIAFRAPDAGTQREWQDVLRDRGLTVTDVKDRQYFQSIYFRDPDWTSGILFEIATDGPGFLTDESEEALGRTLQLPPWLEGRREELERTLPSLSAPTS